MHLQLTSHVGFLGLGGTGLAPVGFDLRLLVTLAVLRIIQNIF